VITSPLIVAPALLAGIDRAAIRIAVWATAWAKERLNPRYYFANHFRNLGGIWQVSKVFVA